MKTILITGSTDGLGLATATLLASQGARVLLHGRDAAKLATAQRSIKSATGKSCAACYIADLSRLDEVKLLAKVVEKEQPQLHAIINNAGVFQTTQPLAPNGLDIRLVVNMIAPYLLTRELLPHLAKGGRVVNVSSAAQAPVERDALLGNKKLSADVAYAESKLGLIMWTNVLAAKAEGQRVLVSVNPKSFLGTQMVHDAYGIAGADVGIGAKILSHAALSPDFEQANGLYFDNDSGRFAKPHPDALDAQKCAALVSVIEQLIAKEI